MPTNQKIAAPFITIAFDSSGTPIYRQLYQTIRRAILSGALAGGSQLPSTRALARQLAVSRMTVLNTYDQLLAEGYIEGVSGSGTFVSSILPDELLEIKEINRQQPESAAKTRTNFSKRGQLLASFNHSGLPGCTGEKFAAFHYGLPALDAFPFQIWSRLVSRRLKKMSVSLFAPGNPAGFEPLRRAIAAYLQTSRAVKCEPAQVIIVAGAQQALSLIAQILTDEKDVVWMENPCYLGARNVFAAAGAKILGVPIDAEGFDLQFALETNKNARLASVTPSHQFPLGTVMSLGRRLALLEWAKNSDSWIIEDDYDSEFRYAGRPLASLQGLDETGRVIYIGTFSKTIFPALRLGYMVVPENLVDVIRAALSLSDIHSPSIEKAAQLNIETTPLSLYGFDTSPGGGLILGYTAFTPGQIKNGVLRLAKALRQ